MVGLAILVLATIQCSRYQLLVVDRLGNSYEQLLVFKFVGLPIGLDAQHLVSAE